jgi:mono/diheme cytochrome c family protein
MRQLAVLTLIAFAVASCVGRPPEEATGEEIYLQLCANCHGDQLQGGVGPALGAGSSLVEQPDEFLTVTVMQGRGRMPSFESSLTDDQLVRLVGYIREVQGQ